MTSTLYIKHSDSFVQVRIVAVNAAESCPAPVAVKRSVSLLSSPLLISSRSKFTIRVNDK